MKWNLGFLREKHARINFPIKNVLQEKENFDALNKVLLLFSGLRAHRAWEFAFLTGFQVRPPLSGPGTSLWESLVYRITSGKPRARNRLPISILATPYQLKLLKLFSQPMNLKIKLED